MILNVQYSRDTLEGVANEIGVEKLDWTRKTRLQCLKTLSCTKKLRNLDS
jgi:hypothetical protein